MRGSYRRIPVEYLRECFSLGDDGVLTWRNRPHSHFINKRATGAKLAGKVAGRLGTNGYLKVTLHYEGQGHTIRVHRIVWAMVHGSWPTNECIDHINRNRTDNRPCNLRDVSVAVNIANSDRTTAKHVGVVGVYRAQTPGKYRAQINRRGRFIHLGTFTSVDEARDAFLAAKQSFLEEQP